MQNGNNPVVFGGDQAGAAFDQSIQAIASVDNTPVMVVDEFTP